MMKNKISFLSLKNQHGGMLVELMLSIAVAAIIIPFVFRYQQTAVTRAKNIAVTKQMENVQSALERYILENKNVLMKPMGKKITRVKIGDLVYYGLSENVAETYKNDFQIRVLKTSDKNNKSTLQGIVILNDKKISPLRTREIVNMGGGKFGFIEGKTTYGGFGAFHAGTSEIGTDENNGIVGMTSVTMGNTEYLWRMPSNNTEDATMQSSLNLGGHDINKIKFFDAGKAQFEEKLSVGKVATGDLVFSNRATLDGVFSTENALVNGALTSESKSLNVSDTLSLADYAQFSSFYTNDLYVYNLTLSGFSVSSSSSDKPTRLRIAGDLDLVLGRVTASYISVGYTGSVTPRLSIAERIQDPKDSSYYWDIKSSKARFQDATFPELSRMASYVYSAESRAGTETATLFRSVAVNSNATVGDYLNAINEIQNRVRARYEMLNLD